MKGIPGKRKERKKSEEKQASIALRLPQLLEFSLLHFPVFSPLPW